MITIKKKIDNYLKRNLWNKSKIIIKNSLILKYKKKDNIILIELIENNKKLNLK